MLRLDPSPGTHAVRLTQAGVKTDGPQWLALLALIVANALWGGSPAASAEAMRAFGPFTVGAGRAGIALAGLSLLLCLRHERPVTGREPAMLGLCGVALFCAFQNAGLRFADATTTAIIGGARPVLIAILACPLLGERLRVTRLAGLALSLAGIAIITLVGTGHTPAATLGALLPLASSIAIALYAVLLRRASGAGALALVAGATRYGFLFLLPGALLELAVGGVPAPTVPDVAAMLYLGIGCSALSFVLVGYAVAKLDVGRFAAFFNIQVLAGVALSVMLLGEALTPARIGGGALVLGGVALAAREPTARAGGLTSRIVVRR